MSTLKKLIQLISTAAFIILFSFLNKLNTEELSRGKQRMGKHEEIFLEASAWSITDRNESISEIRGSVEPASSSLSAHFHPGVPKPLGSKYSRVIVIPRLQGDDISWVSDELPDVDTAVYIANDPLAALHPPKNKGHEVTVYLSYIINHYDALPGILIFMHAHRWTHHNNALLAYDAAEMIRRLNSDYVMREGYVNMRCHWLPGCPEWLHPGDPRESLEKQEEVVLSKCWSELFPSDPLPTALGQACCAQFALSKERVLSIPLSRFVFYRDWITRTPLSDYISGRVWEYSWQFLFTGQGIYCPAEHICYCGGFGLCFGGASKFEEFEELRRKKRKFESEMDELRDRRALSRKTDMDFRPSNASAVRYAYLNNQIEILKQELALRKEFALERGLNPDNRAEECGSGTIWKGTEGPESAGTSQ